MQILKSMDAVKGARRDRKTSVTIGNFDGMHLAHQELIRRAVAYARTHDHLSVVLTFDPHPSHYFGRSGGNERLQSLTERQKMVDALGVDLLWVQSFDSIWANRSAESFIDEILGETLNATHLVVGEDFCFGKGRTGSIETLRRHYDSRMSTGSKGALEVVSKLVLRGESVSSTRVRTCLRAGDFAGAALLLGYPWYFKGQVIHGQRLGRTLGFPTANLSVDPQLVDIPLGSYAVDVSLSSDGDFKLYGVMNRGRRPTVEATDVVHSEVHLFDYGSAFGDQEIYGQELLVRPVKYLRPEKKFDSKIELLEQIKQDCAAAKALMGER